MRKITVLIAEGHPVYRDGLRDALNQRPGLAVVGAVRTGDEAIRVAREIKPAVLIADLDLPGLSGTSIIRSVAAEGLPTRVVIVTDRLERSAIYDAVSAGAAGFLAKSEESAAIGRAVEAVAAGATLFNAEVQSALAHEIRGRGTGDEGFLSGRELEILKLVADGRGTSEIAAELFLSAATVKTHLQRAFAKLGVNDRAAAVAEAMRRGMFD